jgi:hypothetical protein
VTGEPGPNTGNMTAARAAVAIPMTEMNAAARPHPVPHARASHPPLK